MGVISPGAEEPETQRGGKHGSRILEAVWYEGHHLEAPILGLITSNSEASTMSRMQQELSMDLLNRQTVAC